MNTTVIAPGIVLFDNVIDNCQEVVDAALERDFEWKDAEVFNQDNSFYVDKGIRMSRSISVPAQFRTGVEWFSLSKSMWEAVDTYAREFDVPFSAMEDTQILHYPAGVGKYGYHYDAGAPNSRVISAVLYLNDVEEGGETHFDKFDVSITPKAGLMAVFPSNYIYTHEARVPVSGDKFVAVTWFRA